MQFGNVGPVAGRRLNVLTSYNVLRRGGGFLTGWLGVADVDREGGVRRVRSFNRAQEMFLE